ncbi:MAG TPA: hypothetical protein VMF13_01540 [Luteitalea sp.]|nr:hypothetical protein [Luteitalea sp.]
MRLAVPGLILSGWAPARAQAARIHLVIRNRSVRASQPADEALQRGISLGLADVARAAALMGATLDVQHVSGDETADPVQGGAVEVVASHQDPGETAASEAVLRIHTAPLRDWRPDEWSVASRGDGESVPDDVPVKSVSGVEWHPRLVRDGAAALNARFRRHAGAAMDAAAWRGWMAVRVAFDAALRAIAGEADLLAQTFEGHKGQPLRFAEDGHLQQPTYRTGPDGRPVVVAPQALDDDACFA